jgi:hypothetical protein
MATLQPVRILLVGTSNMLSNIVTAALAQAHDLVVVSNIGEHEDLASHIRLTSADAVVVQAREPGGVERFAPLLRSFPALTVVAIDPTGSGFVYQLRPYSIRVAEFSADVLQSVLRTGFGYGLTSPTLGR